MNSFEVCLPFCWLSFPNTQTKQYCPKRALSYTLEATTKKTITFKQRVNKIFLVTHLDFRLQPFILLTKGATLDFFLSAAVNLKLENVSWSLPPGSPKTTARDRKETSCFGTPQRKIHTTSESKFHFTISGSGNFVHCKKQNFFLSLKTTQGMPFYLAEMLFCLPDLVLNVTQQQTKVPF